MLSPLEEHFGYISDKRRLAKYREALSRVVQPGDLVADVGCGFGVLGLICLQAGAGRVWGVDSSQAIEIAKETMARAGLADRYQCISGHSSRTGLPEPVDVLVCDHVGYFGIDYGIIDALGDARRFLKPGGRIVPGRIDLMLAGVASEDGRAKAEGWRSASIPAEYHWLREYGINTKHARMFDAAEIQTAPVLLGTVRLDRDSPELLKFDGSLTAARDGVLDGLGGWFSAELAEDVWMTNSPLSGEQIDRLQVFLAFDEPIKVRKGEPIEVAVSIRHDTSLLTWSVTDPRTGRRQKHSTWKSMIAGEADLARRAGKPLKLNGIGRARSLVHVYVDGKRNAQEILAAVLRDHPDLFPSEQAISRFVLHELGVSAE